MLMGSVFMSALQSEKRVRNELHFFLFSFKRNDILTCKEPSAVHVLGFLCAAHKNRKSQSLAVLLFIVGCLTCFSITIHSRERLSPLWKPVGPLLGKKAALPQEEVKCLCSVVGRHSAVDANVCWCWGTPCVSKEVLSRPLRNVRSSHLKKANIASWGFFFYLLFPSKTVRNIMLSY